MYVVWHIQDSTYKIDTSKYYVFDALSACGWLLCLATYLSSICSHRQFSSDQIIASCYASNNCGMYVVMRS